MKLAGQILGFVAVLIFALSYQIKNPKKLLLIQTVGTTTLLIHYLMIGALSGFALNIICVIRNLIYYNKDKKIFSYKFYPYLLALVVGVVGVFSWQGPASLLIIFALMINTVCLSVNDTQFLRKSVVLTCSMLTLYNFFVHSYGGMINESISVVSSIIGLYRHKNRTP